jgi:hypothetical protein
MKMFSKSLVASAMSGIVLGAATIGCNSSEVPAAKDPTNTAKACCKGQNECKGKGSCKTDKNECKGQNECKGKGGCNSHCPKT